MADSCLNTVQSPFIELVLTPAAEPSSWEDHASNVSLNATAVHAHHPLPGKQKLPHPNMGRESILPRYHPRWPTLLGRPTHAEYGQGTKEKVPVSDIPSPLTVGFRPPYRASKGVSVGSSEVIFLLAAPQGSHYPLLAVERLPSSTRPRHRKVYP